MAAKPCERARAMAALFNEKNDIAEVARVFKCRTGAVREAFLLLKLVPEIQAAIDNGTVSQRATVALFAHRPAEEQRQIWAYVQSEMFCPKCFGTTK